MQIPRKSVLELLRCGLVATCWARFLSGCVKSPRLRPIVRSDGSNIAVLMRKSTPPGDMEHASREVKGHMKSVRHRNFRQNIFVAITIAIVVDIIVVSTITYD